MGLEDLFNKLCQDSVPSELKIRTANCNPVIRLLLLHELKITEVNASFVLHYPVLCENRG